MYHIVSLVIYLSSLDDLLCNFYLSLLLRKFSDILWNFRYDFPFNPTKYIPFYGGAEYHDYHHYVGGLSQSNFASVFTYCDSLYGTDKVLYYFFMISCLEIKMDFILFIILAVLMITGI